MPLGAPAKLSDEQIAYYLGTMCPEADMAFRFAFALYLANDAAFEAVQSAYRVAITKIESYQKNDDDLFSLRRYLMKTVWEEYNNKKASTPPSSPVTQKLSKIDTEMRGIMVSVDVCGLKPKEALQIFGVDESSFREKLASARNQLIELA